MELREINKICDLMTKGNQNKEAKILLKASLNCFQVNFIEQVKSGKVSNIFRFRLNSKVSNKYLILDINEHFNFIRIFEHKEGSSIQELFLGTYLDIIGEKKIANLFVYGLLNKLESNER